jgi:hypothetical protein
LAAAVAGPVVAAVGELLRALAIIAVVVVVLAVAATGAVVVVRLRHGQPRALPPRVYGSRSAHVVQDRAEPRALPAPQEVHVHHHWHGVTAEDVAEILARDNRDGHERVDYRSEMS